MGTGRGTIEFVLSSTVRADVVRSIGAGGKETDELLAELSASTSAVYSAVGDLDDHGLVTETDEGWRLTGSGRVLSDIVANRERCERVLAASSDYFQTHDTSVLPGTFRLRIGALAGGQLVTATETEPQRAVREVSERIAAADSARVISPIYVDSYAEAMPDTPDSKLLLGDALVESFIDSGRAEVGGSPFETCEVRTGDVDVALGVTDEELLLSLPRLDGGYDSESELVVETERAREWGERLFEYYWQQSRSLEAFAASLDS
jgi:predicted transcriptional regulator